MTPSHHFLILITIFTITILIFLSNWYVDKLPRQTFQPVSKQPTADCEDFNGFDENFNNNSGAAHGCKIVPNLVHFVHFRRRSFNFGSTVCMLAALRNQRPDRILVHTDVPGFRGRYWGVLMATPGFRERLIVVRRSFPEEIFAQKMTDHRMLHARDITRIRALMEYGGIYLDTDACVVRNLDEFRKFEMVVGWNPNASLSTHVMIAHKGARFLKEYLESYRLAYNPRKTRHDLPTRKILVKSPQLVHRVENLFGNSLLYKKIYLDSFPEWKSYYVIDTRFDQVSGLKKEAESRFGVSSGFSNGFNETTIKQYPVAYREIVASVWNP
ncbi:hypothetical protein LSTR_LSTR006576 [Laodelphax striatellus]|uniref:Alpha-1,4-N-acetylglucosaminyltransferase n=1 Tax=Laodelphax striatellus TaxID=195883 RepID=A0A482WSS3_LAOST|nr:hypothetical protein LSTR_LSTR006576 [Laodelphax striatellus]